MWANKEVVEFVEWLRLHNDGISEQEKAGFYGLDVYSLRDSLYQVTGYLSRQDPMDIRGLGNNSVCWANARTKLGVDCNHVEARMAAQGVNFSR